MNHATDPQLAIVQHVPQPRPLTPRAVVAIAIAGLVGLFWFHRVDFLSQFAALSGDSGDTRLIAFLLEHQWQALLGHAVWASPPMFFPVQGTLGYADAFVVQELLFAPLRALGCDVLTATQLSALLLNAANYAVMAWLLRRVLHLGTLPTIAGALLFAFNSAKFNQLVHLQLQPLALLPLLAALCVDLGRKLPQLRPRGVFVRLAGMALLLDLQLMSGVYVGWFVAFFLLIYLALALLLAPTRAWLVQQARAHTWPIVGAGVVFVIGAIPFALLYVPVLRHAGWRSYGDAQGMIPQWFSLLVMGGQNLLWGWLEPAIPHFYAQPFFWEHRVGLGLVVTAGWLTLAFVTLRHVRGWPLRRQSTANPANAQHFLALLILAVTCHYALGMKYFGHSPWWFAFHTVPGIKSIRAVSRYVIVLALPMGIALAWAIDALQRRLGRAGQAVLGLLVLLGAVEQIGARDGYSKETDTARIQQMADRLPKDCAAFYLASSPTAKSSLVSVQIDAMFIAQRTGIPTLNGYSGQEPQGWAGLYYARNPDYAAQAAAWVAAKGVRGRVCRLDALD